MDPEVHPEYTDAYVAALPLADCAPVRGDRKQRLGKGKQAKTFRSAFVRATAAGNQEVASVECYACMCARVCVCMSVCLCVYVCVYMYGYTRAGRGRHKGIQAGAQL